MSVAWAGHGTVEDRVKYEMSFVYDLMEWVHPGTIHKYARADQRKLQGSSAGLSSSIEGGSRTNLDGKDGRPLPFSAPQNVGI